MLDLIKDYDILTLKINENIRALKAHPVILEKEEFRYLHPFFEKAMYIAISLSDLNISLKYLHVSGVVKNGYETNYFARIVAHISYELINHKQKIMSEEIFSIVREKCGEDALLEFRKTSKDLKALSKDSFEMLNYIRNNLFGHRSENGMEMAKGIIQINSEEIFLIGKKIFKIYFSIFSAYFDLIRKI